jgi:hypothetical protein
MIPEYGVPDDDEGLLPFSHLEGQLGAAHDYWVASVRPDGRPHAVPVWGVWLDGTLYFGGGKQTRKARNLDRNPDVVVHTGSASDVAIIEGRVREVTDAGEQTRVDDAYEAKYGMRHGPTVWAVGPRVGFGWTTFPDTITRWTF